MSEIALGLGLGLGLSIPCCCYVVGLTLLFCRKNEPNQAEEPHQAEAPPASQPVSPATPMEDFTGSIDDVQTQIFSILQPTKSSKLSPLSVEPKRKNSVVKRKKMYVLPQNLKSDNFDDNDDVQF